MADDSRLGRKSSRERCPIHEAAKNNNHQLLSQLLNVKKLAVNQRDPFGASALHLACHEGNIESVSVLLHHPDILVDLGDLWERGPLYHAARNGHEQIVAQLLEHGAEVDKCNNDGQTPLMKACQHGHTEVARILLTYGADVDRADSVQNNAPVHFSCLKGKTATVRLLIDRGADLRKTNSENANVLHCLSTCASLPTTCHVIRALVQSLDRNVVKRGDCHCQYVCVCVLKALLHSHNSRSLTPLNLALRRLKRRESQGQIPKEEKKGDWHERLRIFVALMTLCEIFVNLLKQISRDARLWTSTEVADWTVFVLNHDCRATFISNDVNGELLFSLTNESLKTELDIGSFGLRSLLLTEVGQLQKHTKLLDSKGEKSNSQNPQGRGGGKRGRGRGAALLPPKGKKQEEEAGQTTSYHAHFVDMFFSRLNTLCTVAPSPSAALTLPSPSPSPSPSPGVGPSTRVGVNVGTVEVIPHHQLQLGKLLGKGYFAEVRRAIWGGTEVAIKILFKHKTFRDQDDQSVFSKEIAILSQVRHPNVIQFFGHSLFPDSQFAIVTEYMSRGDLQGFIMKERPLSEERTWGFARDIARGMAYLHHKNILHRDLSSSNILIADDFTAKIADFGLSRFYTMEPGKEATLTTAIGSLLWLAPEAFKGKDYTHKVDVYSYGICLFELVSGRLPNWEIPDFLKYANEVAHQNYRPPIIPFDQDQKTNPKKEENKQTKQEEEKEEEEETITSKRMKEWKELIGHCWAAEPKDRLEFWEIVEHLSLLDPHPQSPPEGENLSSSSSLLSELDIGEETLPKEGVFSSKKLPPQKGCYL